MLPITLGCGPCCWGVDDVENPHLPPWTRVLDEAAAAGFKGLELGPHGYMPLDGVRLAQALGERGLWIFAGTIFSDLASPGNRADVLRQADEICRLLKRLPRPPSHPGQRFAGPYLTVMDFGDEERDFAAGRSRDARRLPDPEWAGMMETIRRIAEIAAGHGIRAVVHPHAGGFIEFSDELERLERDIPAEVAGLCLDTGHLAYAGMDPAATLRAYAHRLDYVHLKDIDVSKFEEVMGRRVRFFEACAQGVMCPIGRGGIDYGAVRDALAGIGYAGLALVEQERDPSNGASVLADLTASRRFLSQNGFSDEREAA